MKAHLAQGYQTMATCWLVVRSDGQVFAFTDHDANITFDLEAAMTAQGLTAGPGVAGIGSRTYLASAGFKASNLQTSSALNVDTGEAQGILSSPSIIEADLLAGLWDYASVAVFQVNWANLTAGAVIERVGTLGEIQTDRGTFKAEWRGIMQAYQQNLGRIDSPICNAILGDARCAVDLALFTVTGTLEDVSADGMVLFDSARTEPGPTGGLSIIDVTNANPGVVHLGSVTGLFNGLAVTLSGIVGPTALNGNTIVRSLNTTAYTFSLGIDTSDTAIYPPYVSGGTCTPMGGDAGYFDFGVITITSGANAGLSREIKNYVPGQIALQLPFPYPLTGSETYTAVAGCDHSLATCRDKFANVVNMRAFPYLPGLDKIVQVGRHG